MNRDNELCVRKSMDNLLVMSLECPPRPTNFAAELLKSIILLGETAIDATAGNGHDTLFLAKQVGAEGKVIAFDIQEAAISSTFGRIQEAGLENRVSLVLASHTMMEDHADAGSVAAVMFNLGYLPGTDHAVTTGEDTISALEMAVRLLRKGGALSVVCYPGHSGGDDEAARVEKWMEKLPEKGWRVVKYGAIGTIKPAPFLLFAVKNR